MKAFKNQINMLSNKREKVVEKYFQSWIKKDSTVLKEIFANDCIYIESHGTAYQNLQQITLWFTDWLIKGTVFEWPIKRFFHKDDVLIVEWCFRHEFNHAADDKYKYDNVPFEFDGISVIKFNKDNKVEYLKEFKCEIPTNFPYAEYK